MRTKKKVAPLTVTLITIGSLVGGAMGQSFDIDWHNSGTGSVAGTTYSASGFVSGTADMSAFPDVGGYTSDWQTSQWGNSDGSTTYTYTVSFADPIPISSFALLVTEVDGFNRSNQGNPSQGVITFSGGSASSSDFLIINGLAASNSAEFREIEYDGSTGDWSAPTTDAGYSGVSRGFAGRSLLAGANANTFTKFTMTFKPDGVIDPTESRPGDGHIISWGIASPIPEPSSALLLGLGGFGLLARRSRRTS